MEVGQSLIDKASKLCSSDAELARRIGVHRVVIAEMRTGKRAISPSTAAQLADISGLNPRDAAIDSIIDGAKGTRREDALRRILGKKMASEVSDKVVCFLQSQLDFVNS